MNLYIKENIRFIRQLVGDRQEDFALRFGLNRDNIASYERGIEPKLELISRIVEYFNISLDDFFHINLSEIKGLEIVADESGNFKTKGIEKLTIENEGEKTKSNTNLTISNGKKNVNESGINEKYNKTYQSPEVKTDIVEHSEVRTFRLKTDHSEALQQIPLYDMEAVAGLVPLFNDTIKQVPIGDIQIPNLPKCDGAIYITGDSMYPLLKSGDIVLYKRVRDIKNCLFWGEMYLISIDMDGEEYVTVKYVQKSDQPDHVRLVSHNQHHDDKDVPVSKIRALAFIKASIRINSMK